MFILWLIVRPHHSLAGRIQQSRVPDELLVFRAVGKKDFHTIRVAPIRWATLSLWIAMKGRLPPRKRRRAENRNQPNSTESQPEGKVTIRKQAFATEASPSNPPPPTQMLSSLSIHPKSREASDLPRETPARGGHGATQKNGSACSVYEKCNGASPTRAAATGQERQFT